MAFCFLCVVAGCKKELVEPTEMKDAKVVSTISKVSLLADKIEATAPADSVGEVVLEGGVAEAEVEAEEGSLPELQADKVFNGED